MKSSVGSMTIKISTLNRRKRDIFISSGVKVRIILSGRKNLRGGGSKVNTTSGSDSSSASWRARVKIAWWPLWTPSKLPMVKTTPFWGLGKSFKLVNTCTVVVSNNLRYNNNEFSNIKQAVIDGKEKIVELQVFEPRFFGPTIDFFEVKRL